MRANFQNVPKGPVLFLSSRVGHMDLMYAHVQMINNKHVNKAWKLKIADIILVNDDVIFGS